MVREISIHPVDPENVDGGFIRNITRRASFLIRRDSHTSPRKNSVSITNNNTSLPHNTNTATPVDIRTLEDTVTDFYSTSTEPSQDNLTTTGTVLMETPI